MRARACSWRGSSSSRSDSRPLGGSPTLRGNGSITGAQALLMGWQDELLAQLQVSEQAGGLARIDPTGSVAAGLHDSWSDLDVRLTVRAGSIGAFFPETAWLERYGPLYCIVQQVQPDCFVTRAVFEDLRRLDVFVFELDRTLGQEGWEEACEFVAKDRSRQHPGDEFWFSAVEAVVKVARDDLLGAADVALALSRQALALALDLRELRDRAIGNEWASHVLADDASLGEPAGALDHISRAATMFEGLQRLAIPAYSSRRRVLDDLIRQVRCDVSERGSYRPRAIPT